MEAPLQQRIVGAIVLVTLGVIFIPALLDGSGYKARQVKDIEIAEKPRFPPLSVKKNAENTPLKQIKQKDKEAKKADAENKHKKPIHSFALQVGTFASNENAEKLRKKLTKAGYTTYIKKTESRGKTSYKLRIGPSLDRKALEKAKAAVKKSHKIDGYLVNHP